MSSDLHDIDAGSIDTVPIDTEAADAVVARHFERGAQPAMAYGIVAGGALVHAAGFGARVVGGPAPDRDTVFRIASMSKSFTASAVLLLRDAGLLALDDPASKHVPELSAWPSASGDWRPVTIRNLLTMTAGFPTDDPWGDRQQGLSHEDFGSLLAGGISVNWAPGTRFEYSNMGYAILGRVIAAVSGVEYAQFVRTRLLAPLGMTRTGFAAEEFGGASAAMDEPAAPEPGGGANLAQGYRRAAAGWEPVPYEPHGAFAPMGGVFSTVADLAVWVAGFASAYGVARLPQHPLAAASRREMQLPQAVTQWRTADRLPGGGPGNPAYYGFGLFADEDPELGRVVNHSGGYPGFGSNMRWHPATGIGVIALANGTYAGTSALTGPLLQMIVPRSKAYHVSLAPSGSGASGTAGAASFGTVPSGSAAEGPGSVGGPWPETVAARDAADELLRSWDDAAADALFTENVALDAPYSERRSALELVRSRIGEFRASETRPPEFDTPAHCRWWLTGERGTVQAQIQLNPQRPPRVQSLSFAIPPAPGGALEAMLSAVVAWMNSGSVTWPQSIKTAPGADVALLGRRLRMAAVWAGECAPGAFRFGDGSAFVSAELNGEHASVVLTLLVNPGTGELRQADITV